MNNYSLYRRAWRFSGAPHEESKLTQEECKALLRQGGLLVRNTYDFDCQEKTKFWFIIKDRFEGFDELPSRVRNKIRHAQNAFDYRRIDQALLMEKGYPIIADTFADYAVHDRIMNRGIFKDYLDQCEEQTFDFWGIYDKANEKFVGLCTVKLWDKCCEYGLTGILTEYKRNGTYPYYGLYHYLDEYYLEKQGFSYVSDSARTITEHSQIQDFLIQNFNFRKAYCRLEVHYQWWMSIAVTLLYPFRKIITMPKVKAILNMEGMRR